LQIIRETGIDPGLFLLFDDLYGLAGCRAFFILTQCGGKFHGKREYLSTDCDSTRQENWKESQKERSGLVDGLAVPDNKKADEGIHRHAD